MKKGSRHNKETIAAMKKNRMGSKNANWRGGGRRLSGGYVLITLPNGGRVREHRFVMEGHLGRNIKSNEIIHHINGDSQENRLENLELMTKSEHSRHHNPVGRKLPIETRKKLSKYWGQKCAVTDCSKSVRTKGWCNSHYQRWTRYGNPERGRTIKSCGKTHPWCAECRPEIRDKYLGEGNPAWKS